MFDPSRETGRKIVLKESEAGLGALIGSPAPILIE
jgi:hypothetical protein